MAQQITQRKQQGKHSMYLTYIQLAQLTENSTELQLQYTNYKNELQQLAQKLGGVEQEAEEHRFAIQFLTVLPNSI